jgi:perosamine synthetase
MKPILYSKPSIGPLEKEFVYDAIENGWGTHCYDYIFKFQDSFKNYLNVKYAIATSSCTGALHIALKSIGVKAGNEIIVPDATWIASVAPVTYLGATPVFVDVLETTWCIDPQKIEAAITTKTKAIIAVHLYGSLCEMDEIMAIARKHNLYVIEDSAEAIGSEYKGKKAGSIGDFGVFSFHGTKTITTGEGGMLVTNNDHLYEQASILHDHGRDPKIKKMFWAEQVGFKYKMSNLQAALGYAQMQRVEDLVERKISLFRMYEESLSGINGIRMNFSDTWVKNAYWMPTIILGEELDVDRDELISYLNEHGIGARPFFYPVSGFPEFTPVESNLVSRRLSARGINLPSNFEMTKEQTDFIAEIFRGSLNLIKQHKVNE